MRTITFSVDELKWAPEFSALASLGALMHVADQALQATYPEIKENGARLLYPYHAIHISCANAIRRQMEALAATISEFADIVKEPSAPAFLFADASTTGASNDG